MPRRRRNVGAMLSNLGESARSRGDYQAAVKSYQVAILVARQIGNKDSEQLYLSNLGGALVGLGHEHFASAETHLREVLTRERPQVFLYAETYRFLAEALLGQEKLAEALDAARNALALAQRTENQEHIAEAWYALALVTAHPQSRITSDALGLETQGLTTAQACFVQSLKVFTSIGAEADGARTLRARARYELARGERAAATALWSEARAVFERLNLRLELERMDRERQFTC